MPSMSFRIAKAAERVSSLLMLNGYSPVGYQRFLFNKVAPHFAKKVGGVRSEPAQIPGIHAEWLVPEGSSSDRALLYLHGGGYVIGSIESHRNLASQIAAAAGCRALIIDYRLAPENRFPAAVEDAVSSYRWLVLQGYEPAKTAIAGDSAGGGLTAAALVSLRDSGDPLPAAAMLLSPWTDLEVSGESCRTVGWRDPLVSRGILRNYARCYVGTADPRGPLASPIHADLKGLPPLCIHVGTCEVLLDDARRLAERARQDGVEVDLFVCDGMIHVWQFLSPLVPEGREAIEKLGEFYKARIKD